MNDLSKIDAAILCGGLGKRLRGEIGESQKVMAKIGRDPFLDILLQDLAQQGFKRFILMTGYKAESLEEYYRTNKFGVTIKFSREPKPLGTGGALKNARGLIRSDPFVCLNGDSLCSLDYQEFFDFYSAKKADAALVLSKVEDNQDFGTITLDRAQRIISFQEKQRPSENLSFPNALVGNPDKTMTGPPIRTFGGDSFDRFFYVNAGVYCFSKKVFDWMPAAAKFMFETDFFPRIVQKEIYGFVTQQKFLDIGTPERFKKAQTTLRKDP